MTGQWGDLGCARLLETPHLDVFRETVSTPTRPCVEWMVTRRKPAAVVAPRTPEGKFLLVQQERVPVRRVLWEFPAGQVEGTPTPPAILATAHRELGEEAGVRVTGEMILLGSFFSSAGFTDEKAHLFLATDVVPRDEGRCPDEGEAILQCRAFAPEELREWIATGKICDANTLSLFARLVALGHL